MAKSSTGKRKKAVLAVVVTVITGVLITVISTSVSQLISAAGAKNPLQVNSTVVDNSVCNFVAPLSGALTTDPTGLKIEPAELGQGVSCEKALAKVRGARTELSLEAVLAPSGNAAIVLTDITIHVRKSSPLGMSGYYSPAGTGGGGDTLSIEADVENKSAVSKVDVYAQDGTMTTYDSVLAVRPRPTATKAHPLIVDIGLHGDKNYTTFDVDVHWQSSTGSGVVRLNNGGAGYTVAGAFGLPTFRGAATDGWEAGTN